MTCLPTLNTQDNTHFFRGDCLQTHGGTHTENCGFGKNLVEIFSIDASLGVFALSTLSKKSAMKFVRGGLICCVLYGVYRPTSPNRSSSSSYSGKLPTVPVCASPIFGHYSRHRHYWAGDSSLHLVEFQSCQAISRAL